MSYFILFVLFCSVLPTLLNDKKNVFLAFVVIILWFILIPFMLSTLNYHCVWNVHYKNTLVCLACLAKWKEMKHLKHSLKYLPFFHGEAKFLFMALFKPSVLLAWCVFIVSAFLWPNWDPREGESKWPSIVLNIMHPMLSLEQCSVTCPV